MKFFINSRSGVPMYKQLVQQIEKGVTGEILRPGDQLPTVRDVALELTVNPNTVARAYRELENQGIIISVQGRGTFIAEGIIPARVAERELMIKHQLEEIIREAHQLGLNSVQLKSLFMEAIAEWEKGGFAGE